jgi:predicted DNA-binding ribbon-helix-helix protein
MTPPAMGEARSRRDGSTVVKRSLLVAGHATSVSLEQEFWDGLRSIAAERAQSVASLVTMIDADRQSANLSSAIRVFVLRRYRTIPVGTHSETSV